MPVQKVAVTVDETVLREIDRRVAAGRFPNRSKAVQEGLQLLLEREERPRLLAELAKLDSGEERTLAEEVFGADAVWPAY
jgi:Arc/MetJ-type ribon-helix-helix transcriptional regulator